MLREYHLTCKKLKAIASFCTNPHWELGHPILVLDQDAQNHIQQLLISPENCVSTVPLSSLSPEKLLDQPFCKHFVYNCLTWISAVATSLHCVMSFLCLYVPFKPLYTILDLVFPEMLSLSLEQSPIAFVLTRCLDLCLTTRTNSVQKI